MSASVCTCRYIRIRICIYVCEQLPGSSSSPTVTKLGQSNPWPHGTRWLNFERSMSKVKVGGKVCTLLNALLVSFAFTRCHHQLNFWYFRCTSSNRTARRVSLYTSKQLVADCQCGQIFCHSKIFRRVNIPLRDHILKSYYTASVLIAVFKVWR